jgi:hypothetical protein
VATTANAMVVGIWRFHKLRVPSSSVMFGSQYEDLDPNPRMHNRPTTSPTAATRSHCCALIWLTRCIVCR